MMKMTRRKFLGLSALAIPAAVGADARWIEPTSLRVTNLKLAGGGNCRFVHFTDFHYKGDASYAAEVVRTINELQPEFVCFTGDLVEEKRFAPDALDFIRQIKAPVYGTPGNHDYWSGASFPDFERAFAATGGEWLVDRSVVLPKHDLEIVGMALRRHSRLQPARRRAGDLVAALSGDGEHCSAPLRSDSRRPFARRTGAIAFLRRAHRPVGRRPLRSRLFRNARRSALCQCRHRHVSHSVRFNCRPEITVVTM